MFLAVDDWLYTFLVDMDWWSSSMDGSRPASGISAAVKQPIDEKLPMNTVKHVVRWGTSQFHSLIQSREDKATDPDPTLRTRGRRAPFVAIRYLEDDFEAPHQAIKPASDIQAPASLAPGETNIVLSRHPIPVVIRYAIEVFGPNPLFTRRMSLAWSREFQPRKRVMLPIYALGDGPGPQLWPAIFKPENNQSVLSISGSARGDTLGDDAQRHRRVYYLNVDAFVAAPESLIRTRKRYTTACVDVYDHETGDLLESFNVD